eukprot:TRINITY_DN9439_c0_g1_i1.p1 TRINITY_DN9439_c0_g1~~TRINITY_DN9439_c0_g1_i1.p1  ORF type:complete len:463 (+),score=108.26 TRINITY_DN9439_c0_g1_i1:30-1391(+)
MAVTAGLSGTGGAAAQALRALRRAAQLHTERRAAAAGCNASGSASGAAAGRVRSRGALPGTTPASQPEPGTQSSQPQLSQGAETVPAWELPSSQKKQQQQSDVWGSLSTQPGPSAPSIEASQPASQGFWQSSQPQSQPQPLQLPHPQQQQQTYQQQMQMQQPVQAAQAMQSQMQLSQVPLSQPMWSSQPQTELSQPTWNGSQPQAEASSQPMLQQPWLKSQHPLPLTQPPPSHSHQDQGYRGEQQGVVEAAAALAAALAPFAQGGEVKRRRMRYKGPPPSVVAEAPSCVATERRSPSCSSSPSRQRRSSDGELAKRQPRHRKRPADSKALRAAVADASQEVLSRLVKDFRRTDQQLSAGRQGCQKAAAEALKALHEHQRACEESSVALTGAVRAADAALAAVAALERLHVSASARPAALPASRPPTTPLLGAGMFGTQAQQRRRTRRIDGISA